VCSVCKAGTFSAASSSNCSNCGPGQFSDKEAASVCSVCKAGTFAAASSSSCSNCGPGQFSDKDAASVCSVCKAGTFPAASLSSCTDCPRGKYGDVAGGSSEGAACRKCGPAQRPDGVAAAESCITCPQISGRYGNAQTCPEGVFALPIELNGSLWWNATPQISNDSVIYSCKEGAGCAFKQDLSELGYRPFCALEGRGGPLCAVCTDGYYMDGGGECTACPEEGSDDYLSTLGTASGAAVGAVIILSLLFALYIVSTVEDAGSYLDEIEVEGADDGLEDNVAATGDAAAGSAAGSTAGKRARRASTQLLKTLQVGKLSNSIGACGAWLKNILKDKLKIFVSYVYHFQLSL